ncbi:MAG: hypothetical protein JXR52_04025 [Bacteroidales bacterium]|nr:hypothetical protein [Bacteroidales bacterium]
MFIEKGGYLVKKISRQGVAGRSWLAGRRSWGSLLAVPTADCRLVQGAGSMLQGSDLIKACNIRH